MTEKLEVKVKKLFWILLLILCPLVLLYALLLRCRRGAKWPEGLKGVRFAHRGLHHQPDAPENSLAAFRAAVENGYGAELDIHLMKDGNLAVIHDSSLIRTAGADVEVEDLTAEELKQYRLEGTDETIPLFEEVLEIFDGKTPLVVELKCERGNYNALAAAACEMLDRYHVTYCIESFDPRALIWLKNNRPEIIRGQLSGDLMESDSKQSKLTLWILQHLFMNCLARPDFIAFDHKHRDESAELKFCRVVYGVQEVSWTIRSEEKARELEEDGCLIIFEKFGKKI
ncbi:MAG: glycerophosphodiester phosphodiesterase [Lachnospiraceae bacterium]|nr:glycerophosphodiester phosphodiesterase [Lachnospiraceae bacterium]